MATAFHAYYRQNVGKTVFVRALGEGLKQGALLRRCAVGTRAGSWNRYGRLRRKHQPLDDVFATVKSDHLPVPSLLTAETAVAAPDMDNAANADA